MNRMTQYSIRLFAFFLLNLAILPLQAQEPSRKLQIFTTILPQAYFAERIGGDRVMVEALVTPGQNLHAYQPSPRQIARLSQANIYFTINIPTEQGWLKSARDANPSIQIVDITEGIERQSMAAHDCTTTAMEKAAAHKEDEHEHEHDHEAIKGNADPHLWLNPLLVKKMAERIAQACITADPAGRTVYEQNLKQFQQELDALDQEIKSKLTNLKSRRFMIYHPALSYFAQRYELEQIPIEIEGKSPTARALAATINRAKAEGIKVIFVQKQFSDKSARTIAEAIGGRVEPMDDLAKDYPQNLRQITDAIAAANQ